MYGIAMGTLNVWAGDRIAKKKVWTLSGDQGDVWNHVTVDIPSSNDLVVKTCFFSSFSIFSGLITP